MLIRIGRAFQNAVEPETGAVIVAGYTADDPDVRIVFDDYECAREFLSNAVDATQDAALGVTEHDSFQTLEPSGTILEQRKQPVDDGIQQRS